ncbi:MAG: ECF transporter S component [Rikenellaceae bacterium]
MTTSLTVKTLSYKESKSYTLAFAFIAANVILPQLFHLLNFGGAAFLPILLFTLVAAATYGMTAGIVTAIFSPIISAALFGMPTPEMTTILISKGLTLALVLGYTANKFSKISIFSIVVAIAAYQIVGFVVSTAIFDMKFATDAMLISYPGVIMQLIGGYFLVKVISK